MRWRQGGGTGEYDIPAGDNRPGQHPWEEGETLWFEVWGDIHGARWTANLSVVRATNLGVFEVTSCLEVGYPFATFDEYAQLVEWMNDNGYRRVEGRWSVEETPEPSSGSRACTIPQDRSLWKPRPLYTHGPGSSFGPSCRVK